MGAVYFYHLTDSRLETALPQLLTRARARGWRVEVRGRDRAAMEALDAALWGGADDAFLPHGLAGGPHDAFQPVLLTTAEGAAAEGMDCVMAIEGATIAADEAGRLERGCLLFDGLDPRAVQVARDEWRRFADAGIEAQYWAQDGDGRSIRKR